MITWIIILYVAGLLLFLAEFIVPGMICGILGSIMIATSVVLVFQNYEQLAMLLIMIQLVGVILAIFAGMYVLPRSGISRRLILQDSQQANAGWVSTETDEALIGAEGTVFTALRPAGTIMVEGKRYDAVANGSFIDKGARIRVIEVHGSRILVEEADGNTGS